MEGAWGDALDIPLTRRVVVLGALLIWSECGANRAELHSRDFHRSEANFTDVFQNEWETSWTGAPKCCQTGYGLEGTREGVNVLRCVGIEANKNISNVNNFQNLRHNISTQCPSFRLEVLNKVSFDELFFNCVDQLVSGGGFSNELVGLKCEIFNNSDDLSEQDSEATLNKCCPEHFRYDPYFRDCYQVDDLPSEALLNGVAHANLSVDKIKHEVMTCEGQMIVDDFVPENNVYIFNNGVLLLNSSEQLVLNQSTYCIDRTTLQSNHLVLRYCQDIEQTCRERRCFHKCCPDGESMYFQNCTPSQSFKTTNIVSSYDVETYMTLPTRRNSSVIRGYGVVHTLVCNTGMYNTNPNTEPNDWFELDEFGDLIIPYYSSKVSITNYCLEHIYDNESDAILPVYCFPDEKSLREESPWKFILISVGLIMSSIFLMVTFLVYTFLPSLQNLHGKTLMCHVASLFCAYICLIVAQDATPWIENTKWCPNIGYTMLFCFMAAFFWLNTMCIDIWWTFRSMKSVNRGTRKQREKRRFLFYLLYAWGLPLVVTGFTALMDMVDGLVSPKFKPNMGKFGCWFSVIGGRLYFYIPVAILTTCNVAMFVLTAWNCSKVKADLARMQNSSGDRAKRRYLADKNKMMMNVKLFVVMGVTWAIEVISSVVELPQEIWYLADAANALQGVLIFCIFVLKRKVLHKLGRQLGVKLCLKTTATPGGSTTTNDRLNTVCYDPYRIRKSSSNSTLYTASTTFTGTSTRSTPG